jgi:hypothetical protein
MKNKNRYLISSLGTIRKFWRFQCKGTKGDILKLRIGNKSLHEASNDNEVRVVNFATSKNLIVKSTTFPQNCNFSVCADGCETWSLTLREEQRQSF